MSTKRFPEEFKIEAVSKLLNAATRFLRLHAD